MPRQESKKRCCKLDSLLSWVVIFLLIGISFYLDSLPPTRRYMLKANLYKYSFPLKPNTVPTWAVLVYSLLGPWVMIMLFVLFEGFGQRTSIRTFMNSKAAHIHSMTIALWFAVAMTAAVTSAIKNPMGAYRPNFTQRCWPDGNVTFERERTYPGFPAAQSIDGGYPLCTGEKAVYEEGMKSFLSGHSSISMAGLGFLGYYFWFRLGVARGKRSAWRLFLGFLPFVITLVIGVSRIVDYWHHWQDVVCGLVLGLVITTASFQQFSAEKIQRDEEAALAQAGSEEEGLPSSNMVGGQQQGAAGAAGPAIPGPNFSRSGWGVV